MHATAVPGDPACRPRRHLRRASRGAAGPSPEPGYSLLALFDLARVEQAFDLSQTSTGVAPGRLDEDTVFAHRVFVGVTFDF